MRLTSAPARSSEGGRPVGPGHREPTPCGLELQLADHVIRESSFAPRVKQRMVAAFAMGDELSGAHLVVDLDGEVAAARQSEPQDAPVACA